MKKQIILTSVLLLAGIVSGEAMAAAGACDGTPVTTVPALLTGNTLCQTVPEKAQEEHFSGGVLKDFKLGPGHAVDPETVIGSWSATATQVTYNYAGGSSYTYDVSLASGTLGAQGSTYNLCGASTVAVTLKVGTGACP